MDAWGIDGRREHREEIIGWLREAYCTNHMTPEHQAKLRTMAPAGADLENLDVFEVALDEAIRRSEEPAACPPLAPRTLKVTITPGGG